MSISIDGAASQVNLRELFSQELKGKDLNGTESGSSVVLNGDSVTISARDPASGATLARTVPVAETRFAEVVKGGVLSMYAGADTIDEMVDDMGTFAAGCGLAPSAGATASPTVAKMSLGEVSQALKNESVALGEEITNGSTLGGSSKAEETFFDIYALMALLQEVGQQEREAARDLKMSELNAEVASIQTQANKQRESGILGVIVSSVSMAAQVALTAVSVAKSASSIKAAYNTGAAQNANLAETKANTLQAQGKGPEATKANLAKIDGKTSPAAKAQVDAAMKKAGVPEAKSKLDAAKTTEATITEETAPIKEANQTKLNDINKDLNSAKALGLSDADKVGNRTVGELKAEKLSCENNIKVIDSKVSAAHDQTVAAEAKYVKSLETAQTNLNKSYQAASGETSLAESTSIQEGTKPAADAAMGCQQKQKTAGAACKLMDAQVANEKAALGIPPSDDEIAGANVAATRAGQTMANNPAFQQAQNRPWNALFNLLPRMVGELGQSCANMATQLVNAEGTEEQANQKKAEAFREETCSLFSQAQELIASARDCCKAIMQAESQSVEQIIRA